MRSELGLELKQRLNDGTRLVCSRMLAAVVTPQTKSEGV